MPSVMIVDDLQAVHEMLGEVVQSAGLEYECFYSGYDALKRYKEHKFDVVLADVSMKPMDGIELLKKIKAYDSHAVVVMITGYSSSEIAMKAFKYGAYDYVEKPFRIDKLIQTLNRAIDPAAGRSSRGQTAGDEATDTD